MRLEERGVLPWERPLDGRAPLLCGWQQWPAPLGLLGSWEDGSVRISGKSHTCAFTHARTTCPRVTLHTHGHMHTSQMGELGVVFQEQPS